MVPLADEYSLAQIKFTFELRVLFIEIQPSRAANLFSAQVMLHLKLCFSLSAQALWNAFQITSCKSKL